MVNLTKPSKYPTLILRHNPDLIGIQLDSNGWANIQELIDKLNIKGKQIDLKLLDQIIQNDTKNRYSFNYDKTKIRANQGHSIRVDLDLKEVEHAPISLYHGTVDRNVKSILENGLQKKNRHYVHLTNQINKAIEVGSRYGTPAVLKIDVHGMIQDGIKLYISENNIYLVDYVDPKYIQVLTKVGDTFE